MIKGIKNKTNIPISFGNITINPNCILTLSDTALLVIKHNYTTFIQYNEHDIVPVNKLEEELIFESRDAMYSEILTIIDMIPIPTPVIDQPWNQVITTKDNK